jgi:hypothetical protein
MHVPANWHAKLCACLLHIQRVTGCDRGYCILARCMLRLRKCGSTAESAAGCKGVQFARMQRRAQGESSEVRHSRCMEL